MTAAADQPERTRAQRANAAYLEAHDSGDWARCMAIAERMGWWNRYEAARTRQDRREPPSST